MDLCISMHRELWIRSRVDPVVTLSVNRFVKCFVMYFDLRLVFPRVDLFRKADPSESAIGVADMLERLTCLGS